MKGFLSLPLNSLEIKEILQDTFSPHHLEIQDDSGKHAGHSGNTSGGGHYRVLLVAEVFEGKTLLEQHRMVHDSLGDLLSKDINALALTTLTPAQWRK